MSLNIAREPQVKRVRHSYRFEPQWGPEGAVLQNDTEHPEPKGYIDEKLTDSERTRLARGRILRRAGGERWIGGKTWHVEASRRGLNTTNKRGLPESDRLSRRPATRFSVEPGELYNPSRETVENYPMYKDGKDGRYNGRFAGTYQKGEASPVMTVVFEPHLPTLRSLGLV